MSPTGLSRAVRALGCALLCSLLAMGPVTAETTTYVYDAAGRLIGAVDGSGKVVSYKYDNAGNRTQVSNDPFFAEILPASWTSSSSSGATGLTTANGMRDGDYASASSVHVTTSQAGPWIRAHFPAPVYIDNTCVVPAAYGAIGPANVDGAVVEYSTDNGATWQSGGTVTGATAGVCGRIALRVTANSVRYRLTGTGQLAAGDIRFFSAGSGNETGPGAPVATDKTLSVAYGAAGSVDLTPVSGAWTSITLAGAQAAKGTVTISGPTATYTPASGQSGSDVFGYQATGPGGASNIANVYVTIGQQAVPPTVSDKTATTSAGQTINIDLTPQGAWTSVQFVPDAVWGQVGPPNGSAVINGATATYTPNPGFAGNDWFYYAATGPGGTSAPARVSIQVLQVPPVVSSKSISVTYNADNPGIGGVNATPSGSWSMLRIKRQPSIGTASVSGAWLYYSSVPGQLASDSFEYEAIGAGGTSAPATVSVTIAPPAPPVVDPKTMNVAYNTSGSVPLSGKWFITSYEIVSQGSKGVATVSGSTATYTPNPGATGTDSFTYRGVNLGGPGAPATVSVTITAAPFSVGISSPTYYRRRRGTAYIGLGSPSSVSATATGGAGGYTYQWVRISGDTTTTATAPTNVSTIWRSSAATQPGAQYLTSTWQCIVTDAAGNSQPSPPVEVTIEINADSGMRMGVIEDGPLSNDTSPADAGLDDATQQDAEEGR